MLMIRRATILTLLCFSALLFSCEESSEPVLNDPDNLVDYRGNDGMTYEFRVFGSIDGSVWGGLDGFYTDDSNLATAAVHAGILAPGQTGNVTVVIRPGRVAYFGSTANGVSTRDYGEWWGSYEFLD